ncbi:MBL fold metallo-hydrolase [Actinocatenispora rupis]|uniref:MBL fold metallo-hydrolase n=1 Tax=Actinocatenispora rupis TaxID=519421 RepID=A0A8J3J9Z6_9ACTN|nr:MBL fold metallo-hydrolase [Actinocatenispora rupis]GID10953.1 MBL fold metallo-hydrolase [Actinocatenispora rupis]
MRLTVVGCAGSAPGPDSACSSYLVEAGGYRLLLDLGPGASGPLQRYVLAGDVDAVVLSHAHSDHHADLTQLGRLRAETAAPPLPLTGPSDMPDVLRTDPDSFTPTIATPGPHRYGPLDVRLARVDHGECWATRIGDALCYTADTGPCQAIDELADGCRVLLAEASGSDADGPIPRHLTAGDAGRLAARAGARLLVLTHLRAWQDHPALLAEAAALAGCPVVLAHPGLRVAL